eukprot:PhF_6_TR39705/c0_g1_i2/m.59046
MEALETNQLSLRKRGIETLAHISHIFRCANVIIVDLSHNHLTSITLSACPWGELKSLQILKLHSNDLCDAGEIGRALRGCFSLQYLTLYDNPRILAYRNKIVERVPQLIALDDYIVADAEKRWSALPKRLPPRFRPFSLPYRISFMWDDDDNDDDDHTNDDDVENYHNRPTTTRRSPFLFLSKLKNQIKLVSPSILIQRCWRRYCFRKIVHTARKKFPIKKIKLSPLILVQQAVRKFLAVRAAIREMVNKKNIQHVYVTSVHARDKICHDLLQVKYNRREGRVANVNVAPVEGVKVIKDQTTSTYFQERRHKPYGTLALSSLIVSKAPPRATTTTLESSTGPNKKPTASIFNNKVSQKYIEDLIPTDYWKRLRLQVKKKERAQAAVETVVGWKRAAKPLWCVQVYDENAIAFVLHKHGSDLHVYLSHDIERVSAALHVQRWWRGCMCRARLKKQYFLQNGLVSLIAAAYFSKKLQLTWRCRSSRIRLDFLRILQSVAHHVTSSSLYISMNTYRLILRDDARHQIAHPLTFMLEQRCWLESLRGVQDPSGAASFQLDYSKAQDRFPNWLKAIVSWKAEEENHSTKKEEGDDDEAAVAKSDRILSRVVFDGAHVGMLSQPSRNGGGFDTCSQEVFPLTTIPRYGNLQLTYRTRTEALMRALSLVMLTYEPFLDYRLCFEPKRAILCQDAAQKIQVWYCRKKQREEERRRRKAAQQSNTIIPILHHHQTPEMGAAIPSPTKSTSKTASFYNLNREHSEPSFGGGSPTTTTKKAVFSSGLQPQGSAMKLSSFRFGRVQRSTTIITLGDDDDVSSSLSSTRQISFRKPKNVFHTVVDPSTPRIRHSQMMVMDTLPPPPPRSPPPRSTALPPQPPPPPPPPPSTIQTQKPSITNNKKSMSESRAHALQIHAQLQRQNHEDDLVVVRTHTPQPPTAPPPEFRAVKIKDETGHIIGTFTADIFVGRQCEQGTDGVDTDPNMIVLRSTTTERYPIYSRVSQHTSTSSIIKATPPPPQRPPSTVSVASTNLSQSKQRQAAKLEHTRNYYRTLHNQSTESLHLQQLKMLQEENRANQDRVEKRTKEKQWSTMQRKAYTIAMEFAKTQRHAMRHSLDDQLQEVKDRELQMTRNLQEDTRRRRVWRHDALQKQYLLHLDQKRNYSPM